MVSKRAGAWRCNTCNTKTVELYRAFGTWPTPEFKTMTESEQRAFFAKAAGKSSKELAVFARDELEKYESHEDAYEEGGKFLPLGKWEKDGFDIEAIRNYTKPHNIKTHDVLGVCYRVPLLWQGKRGAKGKATKQVWNANTTQVAKKLKEDLDDTVAAAFPALPLDEELSLDSVASVSSSSSESSTSTSSGRKKKKKDKQRKAIAKKKQEAQTQTRQGKT